MRIMIKGGVWKNTEDEILKVAVMKYGLNQWARISSLLVRKSAKQCKARWYEWLDPAIKKTEWTREEDEKLLHLAKLFPQQWRTIAPIVGRTPAQCLERYEKLLDEAINKDNRYDPADDPRRLRPGEIDPNPESKPARPDPVDMDEDEKEMLAEARARLANTRGKKAKRKAREKLLFEAKRLAQLQKNRELRNAGLGMRGYRYRSSKSIDYNNEVPFEQKPPPGFYDTASEIEKTKSMQQQFRPSSLEQLEGKRRKDIEAQLIKQDIKQQKLREGHEAPVPLEDASNARGRRQRRLMLPAPQVSERELMQIARMGSGDRGSLFLEQQQQETNQQTALSSLRTPRNTIDKVALEVENQGRLLTAQTPLLGGENPLIHPSDFTGVTPRSNMPSTPNPLSQANRVGGGVNTNLTPSVAGTPILTSRGGTRMDDYSTRLMGTPISTRDALGINDQAKEQKHMLTRVRNSLLSDLKSVPQPQHKYEMQMPELEDEGAKDEKNGGVKVEEDAADRDARLKREQELKEQEELKKRSQVLQRGLPRPPSSDNWRDSVKANDNSDRAQAIRLLDTEIRKLITYENTKYPIKKEKEGKGKKNKKGGGKVVETGEVVEKKLEEPEEFEEQELIEAQLLLDEEVQYLKKQMAHDKVTPEEYLQTWKSIMKEYVWDEELGDFVKLNSLEGALRVNHLEKEFEELKETMKKESKKGKKQEEKVSTLTKGLIQKQKEHLDRGQHLARELSELEIEYVCFQQLQQQEQRSLVSRKFAAQQKLTDLREQEHLRQIKYRELEQERSNLLELLEQNQE